MESRVVSVRTRACPPWVLCPETRVVMNRDKPQNGCVHPGALSVPTGPFFSFRLSTQELGSKTEMRFRKGQDPFLRVP